MDAKILIDTDAKIVTLSNVGKLDELDIAFEDINEDFDIAVAMEQIDTFAQSGELDAQSDIVRYVLVNAEEIESLRIETNETEKEACLEEFVLKHDTPQNIQEFIDNANEGDVIYLRKESGKAHFEISIQSERNDTEISFGYFDCSGDYDPYDLLDESYLDEVCDSILPEKVSVEDGEANLDVFDFEPQMISGTLYKVKREMESDTKILEKVDLPSYYFQDTTQIEER